MQLDGRLITVASLIPKGYSIADIGTDHAYLPIYLVTYNICPKVIATDLSPGPLNRAKENVQIYNLSDKIELRLGEGLEPIAPGEVDAAVIAGMGGETIARILQRSDAVAETLDRIIIQPMTNQPKLRKNLFEIGFSIIDERVAKDDGKFYEIIVIQKKTQDSFDDIDVEIGPILREKRDSIITEYLTHRLLKFEKLVCKLENMQSHYALRALKEYKRQIAFLKEVLK